MTRLLHSLTYWLQTYCWDCTDNTNEWLGLRVFIERRGRCFYCRIDHLDMKYGPGQQAEMVRQLRKDKKYLSPPPNRRERRHLKKVGGV